MGESAFCAAAQTLGAIFDDSCFRMLEEGLCRVGRLLAHLRFAAILLDGLHLELMGSARSTGQAATSLPSHDADLSNNPRIKRSKVASAPRFICDEYPADVALRGFFLPAVGLTPFVAALLRWGLVLFFTAA